MSAINEQMQQLDALKESVASTWQLLDIDGMIARMHGAEQEMGQVGFWNDQDNATRVSKLHESLKTDIDTWRALRDEIDELVSLAQELHDSPDDAMVLELENRTSELQKQFEKLEFFVLMHGQHDQKNAIVAVHAGSGGTEAQDWAEMLRRMIMRYAEQKGWQATLLEETRGNDAGIKSSLLRIEGRYAYGHLQSEHGTHRLVRISPFDAEKMRHTSFALLEVIPEMESHESVDIDPKDLRIDTYMSSGKGGQSVNTTYSAVRIVHIPTGITVQCQNERSQLQNKETAMKILQSKLQTLKERQEQKEREELRGEYKSAEWGNQIRSYVLHPYKMVKDLRSRHESPDPETVLDGDLDPFVEAYLRWKKSQ